jgi:hypothetical protein
MGVETVWDVSAAQIGTEGEGGTGFDLAPRDSQPANRKFRPVPQHPTTAMRTRNSLTISNMNMSARFACCVVRL